MENPIEKHDCEGGAFHTIRGLLDCEECEAVIPNLTGNPTADVTCGSCGTTFVAEDLADARVEEIMKCVADHPKLLNRIRILREVLAELMAYEDDRPNKGTRGHEIYTKGEAVLEETKEEV